MTRTQLYSLLFFLSGSLLLPTKVMAQNKRLSKSYPVKLVVSYPGTALNDTIYLEYDALYRLTGMVSKFNGARGEKRAFRSDISYHNNGQISSIKETSILETIIYRQRFDFEYDALFLKKIKHQDENGELNEVLVNYSAPTDTYSFEHQGVWFNYSFDHAGNLLSYRIKGYEVLSLHLSDTQGIVRDVPGLLTLRLVTDLLKGMQLVHYALSNKQVDLMVYNDQPIAVKTRKDEFGRIALIDFELEELGIFQTTSIEYEY